MKTLLALLLLIPSLSWANDTLGEIFNFILNTELETLFKWALKGLGYLIVIGLILFVGAWLIDKSNSRN